MDDPRLTHDLAEPVGADLRDHLLNTLLSDGGERLIDDELFWADTVQLVLRRARVRAAEAEALAEAEAGEEGE